MPTYRDEVVILRTHKLGEADRIVTMLSRRHGKLRAVAKGVRRTSSRFGARLEPFMVADVQLYQGRSLDIVQQAESLGSYGADIAVHYDRYTSASAMVETADRLNEAEATPQQYLLLVGGLRALARGEHASRSILDSYLLRAMALSGWAPGARRVRALRRAPDRTTRSSRSSAGSICRDCAPAGAARVAPDTVALLQSLMAGEWDAVDDASAGRDGRRLRPHRGLRAVAPRARHPLALTRRILATGGRSVTPKPYTHRDAVPYRPIDWTGVYPPAFPKGSVPEHVAIVMDGNGRWANKRGLTRVEGHKAGEAALLDVVAGAIQAGVKHLSVYAFSTENWSRSPDEVRFLMGFNRDVLHRRRDQLNEWGVRVRWAGRKPRLWGSVIKELQYAEQLTAGNDVLTLTMCVNYGGRVELVDAVRSIADDVAAGRLRAERGVGEAHPAPPLHPGHARRRSLRALERRAAHLELPAVGVRVRGVRLPRHALAGLHARRSVARDRALPRPRPPLRRCHRRARATRAVVDVHLGDVDSGLGSP